MSAAKHRIYFLIQRVAHRLKTEADASLTEACGLTTAQAATLTIIASDGPVTQKYVASALAQRESAMTAMASRLLKAGYIRRTQSKRDARAWELSATKAGSEALSKTRTSFQRINHALDSSFEPDEIERLQEGLSAVLLALEDGE